MRWRYGEIRDADSIIEAADRLSTQFGHPPTYEELVRAVQDPRIATLADRLGYEPSGDGYVLTLICGFDCAVNYDSRSHLWR